MHRSAGGAAPKRRRSAATKSRRGASGSSSSSSSSSGVTKRKRLFTEFKDGEQVTSFHGEAADPPVRPSLWGGSPVARAYMELASAACLPSSPAGVGCSVHLAVGERQRTVRFDARGHPWHLRVRASTRMWDGKFRAETSTGTARPLNRPGRVLPYEQYVHLVAPSADALELAALCTGARMISVDLRCCRSADALPALPLAPAMPRLEHLEVVSTARRNTCSIHLDALLAACPRLHTLVTDQPVGFANEAFLDNYQTVAPKLSHSASPLQVLAMPLPAGADHTESARLAFLTKLLSATPLLHGLEALTLHVDVLSVWMLQRVVELAAASLPLLRMLEVQYLSFALPPDGATPLVLVPPDGFFAEPDTFPSLQCVVVRNATAIRDALADADECTAPTRVVRRASTWLYDLVPGRDQEKILITSLLGTVVDFVFQDDPFFETLVCRM